MNAHGPVATYADEHSKTQQERGKVAGFFHTAFRPLAILFTFLRRRTNLTIWIVVGMIVGILFGQFAPNAAVTLGPLGTVFIRMIQTVVVSPPL